MHQDSIDPFFVSKLCDAFSWVEHKWRQKDSSGRFTHASEDVLIACFLTMTEESLM